MAVVNWPWTVAISQLQAALGAVRSTVAKQQTRIILLEHDTMTQQASLEALTAKVTALTTAFAAVSADISTAVAELDALKAQISTAVAELDALKALISALPVGTAIDDSAVLDQLTASIDSVVTGLTGGAAALETAVTAAKA